MAPPSPAPGPEFLALQQAVAGRYSLVRQLGRGGMRIVFLARDLALDRLVAIKLLPPALAGQEEARQRFLREARTAAGLSHPHIVPIHTVEAKDDLVYFVMAYVEGETLGERVRRAGPLGADEVMRVVQEVAWALGHAHAHGVVHRDVKPDNILLDRASGRAMVTDFGIAHALAHDTPADRTVRGTPQYVSPEVVQGATGDARSDLYALGVTAWVVATGRHPFEASTAAALVLAHVHTEAPSLVGVASVPSRFALAVDRCLHKDPAERWPSADAFSAEIDAARSRRPPVPAAVRAFLREWESVGGEVATAGTASVVAFAEALGLLMIEIRSKQVSFDIAILIWVFMLIGVLTAGLAKARLGQVIAHARALLRAGFTHARLGHAQLSESVEREDERSAVAAVARSQRRETIMLLGGTVLGTAGAFALAFSSLGDLANILGAAGAVVLPTIGIRTLWRFLARDAIEPLWSRVLRGPIGGSLFRVAGMGMSAPPPSAALEGLEPTAIALGQAAQALYAALPAPVRDGLEPGIPELIDGLERRAMQLRARQHDVEGNSERAARTAAQFSAAVSALETLRLELLRLTMRAATPEGFTSELAKVREVGQAIDRHLEANEEVAGLLIRERTPSRTR